MYFAHIKNTLVIILMEASGRNGVEQQMTVLCGPLACLYCSSYSSSFRKTSASTSLSSWVATGYLVDICVLRCRLVRDVPCCLLSKVKGGVWLAFVLTEVEHHGFCLERGCCMTKSLTTSFLLSELRSCQ